MNFERGSLWAEYVSIAQLAQQSQAWQGSVLGIICYGGSKVIPSTQLPTILVNTPKLTTEPYMDAASVCEVWHSNQLLKTATHSIIHYRYNEDILFGCLTIEEQDTDNQNSTLQIVTEQAYTEIFQLIKFLGYDSILRIWNYFTAMNAETHGIERYRQFNIGRQSSFIAHNRATIGNVPTSSALGTNSGGLSIAFIAVRNNEVINVENPRQISAYYYPSQYGPRAPIFSRAGFITFGQAGLLFVSGTASIVGHQTQHCGDVAAQTQESMNNLSAVVDAAKSSFANIMDLNLSDLTYKVYIRHPTDLPIVHKTMQDYMGLPSRAIYLQADICRADLLVEVEASNCHPF